MHRRTKQYLNNVHWNWTQNKGNIIDKQQKLLLKTAWTTSLGIMEKSYWCGINLYLLSSFEMLDYLIVLYFKWQQHLNRCMYCRCSIGWHSLLIDGKNYKLLTWLPLFYEMRKQIAPFSFSDTFPSGFRGLKTFHTNCLWKNELSFENKMICALAIISSSISGFTSKCWNNA